MRPQATPEVDGFSDVERAALFIAEDIHSRDGRRLAANPLARPLPGFPAIADDERLADEPARK